MTTAIESLERQMRRYARRFLKAQYGQQVLKKLQAIEVKAVNDYDSGGLSEATESGITIAAKRDVVAGKLTATTKLIVRHELGHMLDDDSPSFPEFEEEIIHERIAWRKAKPRNAAENWYKNLSIRTHIDPLKMQSLGFPRPEIKVSREKLQAGTGVEVVRMSQNSVFVDRQLAERFAMANLIENPNYYGASN